jgi:hypothetical protein
VAAGSTVDSRDDPSCPPDDISSARGSVNSTRDDISAKDLACLSSVGDDNSGEEGGGGNVRRSLTGTYGSHASPDSSICSSASDGREVS